MSADTGTLSSFSLPTETLLKVLSYTDLNTLCRTERVCKRWKAIHSDNTNRLWRPQTCSVSEDYRVPYLLDGETYKDVCRIYGLWETFTLDKLRWNDAKVATITPLTGLQNEEPAQKLLINKKILGVASTSYPGRKRGDDTGNRADRDTTEFTVELGHGGAIMYGGKKLSTFGILLPSSLPQLSSQHHDTKWQLATTHSSNLLAARPRQTKAGTVQIWDEKKHLRVKKNDTISSVRTVKLVPRNAILYVYALTLVSIEPWTTSTDAAVRVWDLSGTEPSLKRPHHSYTIEKEYPSVLYGISDVSIAISATTLHTRYKRLLIKHLNSGINRCDPIPFSETITSLQFGRTHLFVGSVARAGNLTVTLFSLSSYTATNTFSYTPASHETRLFDRLRLSENGMQLSFITGQAMTNRTLQRLHVLDVGNGEGHVWKRAGG
ncbi:hypothetical protein HK097_005223, partial [Rhizophlyctis rosea]